MTELPLQLPQRVPQEQMTTRARMYLNVAAARHLIIGIAMIAAPATFGSRGFQSLFLIFPMSVWTALLIIGGLHLAYASAMGKEGSARMALIFSGSISLMWAVGFAVVLQAGVASVFGATILGALACKDFIMCAQPMRSPFEKVFRLYGGRR
jgi:FtsH-binding integral membrane protein